MATFLARCERVRKYAGVELCLSRRKVRRHPHRRRRKRHGTGAGPPGDAWRSLDAHSPKWVLSCGFAGALVADIRVGDIVVADSIVDGQGQILMIDVGFPADRKPGHPHRPPAHARHNRATRDGKAAACRAALAIAVDMESLAVAQVCRERGARFLGIRVISDDLTSDLPAEVLSLIGPDRHDAGRRGDGGDSFAADRAYATCGS